MSIRISPPTKEEREIAAEHARQSQDNKRQLDALFKNPELVSHFEKLKSTIFGPKVTSNSEKATKQVVGWKTREARIAAERVWQPRRNQGFSSTTGSSSTSSNTPASTSPDDCCSDDSPRTGTQELKDLPHKRTSVSHSPRIGTEVSTARIRLQSSKSRRKSHP